MALSAKALRRLETLIAYMDKLKADGHFKMRQWAAHNGMPATIEVHGIKDDGKVDVKHLLKCGMSACAAGWACTIPSFQRAGLMMRVGPSIDDPNLRPVYKDAEHFDAITAFFDISEKRARQLFGPYRRNVRSPKEWAQSARRLISKWRNV